MPDLALLSVIAIVLLALVFDFTNGFHDAANSIATVVSTRVLTPRMAVIWAATFNFVAFFVFHTKVANTVGKTVDPAVVSEAVVFAGLVGAIAWNLFTWWLGLPTSSSHALIGGFAGAGVAKAGFSVLNAASLEKTILFIVLSPLFGLALGFLLMLANLWLFRKSTPARVDGLFRRLQLVSAAAFSLGHGGNDAQKTMGIISALLVGAGYLQLEANGDLPIPLWVVIAAYTAISLGHPVGRLADRQDPRPADHRPQAGWRLLGRDRRRLLAVPGHLPRRPRLHHPHHHRGDRRRRRDPPPLRGPLGRRRPDRLGLGPHHPRRRHHRRRHLRHHRLEARGGRPHPRRRARRRRPRHPPQPPRHRNRRARPSPPSRSSLRSAEAGVRLAVLDVGSNTIHLAVVDGRPDGTFMVVARERDTLRLAEAAFPS